MTSHTKSRSPSPTEIISAFGLLFEKLLHPKFAKSRDFRSWSEKEHLPLIRTFLLGQFGDIVEPEVDCALPARPSGKGKLDFVVGEVAVEVAVRDKGWLTAEGLRGRKNAHEIEKLSLFEGPGVLILWDFHTPNLEEADFQEYVTRAAQIASPGRVHSLTVASFSRSTETKEVRRTVRDLLA